MRTVLKGWKKQEEREAQGRPPDPTPPGDGSSSSMNLDPPEEQSHDWKEGSRIGEAANPGPEGHNHIGSRAPNEQQEQTEAPARQHGVRAVSDSPWGHKRREPGERYVARQATSSPPHHERATIVSKSKKQRAPWELPAPRGSGTNVQITPCKYGGSGPAPQHDGGQRPIPRELVPPPPHQGRYGGKRVSLCFIHVHCLLPLICMFSPQPFLSKGNDGEKDPGSPSRLGSALGASGLGRLGNPEVLDLFWKCPGNPERVWASPGSLRAWAVLRKWVSVTLCFCVKWTLATRKGLGRPWQPGEAWVGF